MAKVIEAIEQRGYKMTIAISEKNSRCNSTDKA